MRYVLGIQTIKLCFKRERRAGFVACSEEHAIRCRQAGQAACVVEEVGAGAGEGECFVQVRSACYIVHRI